MNTQDRETQPVQRFVTVLHPTTAEPVARYHVQSECGGLSYLISEVDNMIAIPGQVSIHRWAIEPILNAIREIEAEEGRRSEESQKLWKLFGDDD